MRELSPEEINEGVDLILEQHPELLDEDPATVLGRLFNADDTTRLVPIPVAGSDEASSISPKTFEAVSDYEDEPDKE